MTRTIGKFTAMLLAIIMVVGLVPFGASAADKGVYFGQNGLLYTGGNGRLAVIGYDSASSTRIKNLQIPETVNYNGKNYTVTAIANGAFNISDGSSPLESVTIPASVDTIESYVFRDCQQLRTVTFAEGSKLTSMGYEVFKNCYELTSVNLPEGLTSIGKETFFYCCRLTSINVPQAVTSIGDEAFALTKISEITIPAGVTSFGNDVFDQLLEMNKPAYLKSIIYKGTRAQWDALLSGKSLGSGTENVTLYPTSTITFDNMGRGEAIDPITIEGGTPPHWNSQVWIHGPQPEDNGYVVKGWYPNKEFNTYPVDFREKLTGDITVYALWKKVYHKVTYKVENGKWADGTSEPVTEIVYDGCAPSAIPTGMTTERGFDSGSWDNNPQYIVWDDREYTYTFNPLTLYTVKWLNDDGTEFGSDTYYEGEDEPAIDRTPEKPEDLQFTYVFDRWDYGTVDGTVKTYRPIFTNSEKTLYTVIWLNDDGTEFGTKTYYEGQDEPTITGKPVKASDLEYNYSFKNWDEGTSVDETTKVYKPIFNQTDRPEYSVNVGYGTADPAKSKQGKLITLTPDPADDNMRFTGWNVMSGNITIENNSFIMPAENVELYATYAFKKNVDVYMNFSDDNGYAGKLFTVEGTVEENGEVLDVGGEMTITFSDGTPDADGAEVHTVPVHNGRFSLALPALSAGKEKIWAEYSGYGEYGEALIMNNISIYGVSFASINEALAEEDIKREYELGEQLDTSMLYIMVYWADGLIEYVSVTADSVSGFDSTKPGIQKLTVTCPYPTDDELNYSVTIKEKTAETTEPETAEPTQPVTDTPTESAATDSTQPVTDTPTESAATDSTQPVTDTPTESAATDSTQPVTDTPTESAATDSTQPVTDTPTESAATDSTQPVTDTHTESAATDSTQPITDTPTESAATDSTQPVTDTPTESAATDSTQPVTDTPTEPLTTAPTDVPTQSTTAAPTQGTTAPQATVAPATVAPATVAPATQSPTAAVTAKAENTMTVKAKKITAKAGKKVTVKKSKAFKVKNAVGKVSFRKVKGNKKITVKKNGKIVVKKGLRKGKTYKIIVTITANGNNNFKKLVKSVTVKIKVK